MIVLTFLFALLWDRAPGWGFKDGVLHNSIWLERAAGVYHREGRSGKYQLTYDEAKSVCEYEGGHLATYQQLEAARKIGFHMCAAGWLAKGRVGYPIVKPGSNCGFGKTGIVDYGFRLNKSEKWDAYCYNPNGKACGGIFTDSKHVFKTPGYPKEYEDDQICYWHVRVKYGQQIQIQFLDFDLEDDTACMADYLEIYDSYDDVNGFVGRCPLENVGIRVTPVGKVSSLGHSYGLFQTADSSFWEQNDGPAFDSIQYCGDELPDNIISTGNIVTTGETGNVMTLKFLSDASVTAGGFQIEYTAISSPKKNTTTKVVPNTKYFAGKFGTL